MPSATASIASSSISIVMECAWASSTFPTRRCARSQERFSTSTKTVSIARVSRMDKSPILRPRNMAQRAGFLPPRPPGAPGGLGGSPRWKCILRRQGVVVAFGAPNGGRSVSRDDFSRVVRAQWRNRGGGGGTVSGDDIGIADAIESLREALTAAIEKGDQQKQRMRFRLQEPVVLELQAAWTKDAHGKLGWKVVELGGSYTSANTHKVTLELHPEWWDEPSGQYKTDFRISADLPSQAQPKAGGGVSAEQHGAGDGGAADDPKSRKEPDKGLEDD